MTSEVVWRQPWPGGPMASEVAGGKMHMDTRVIKVADLKYEVI